MICHGWQFCCIIAVTCALALGCRSNASRQGREPLEERAALAVRQASHNSLRPANAPRETTASPTALQKNALQNTSQQDDNDLPVPAQLDGSASPPQPAEVINRPDALRLDQIIASVQQAYPPLIVAELERQIAAGQQLSAAGQFDLMVKAFGIAAPRGFYKTYRNGLSLDQPLFTGGYLYGGYKIGDGNFQPWFKERETDEGGEFSLGLGLPLLKDRAIDKRRAALFKSDLQRQAVEPLVRATMLEFVRVASGFYWSWVAAGQSLEAQRYLLENAQARVRQIEERVRAGDLGEIVRINNEQLIALREAKVIEAERKLQESAIKLSLFYRRSDGRPQIPPESQLPDVFPNPVPPGPEQIDADIARALNASPELAELELRAEQVRVELRNAENMLLPKLDARALASKDVGHPASSKRDKTPLELEAGLYGEVPLQRREARGKIESTQGKLSQINTKRTFVADKIRAAVQDAVSALVTAAGRIDRSRTNLRLARRTLELGRLQFDTGNINLIELNLLEQSVTEAELLLITSQTDFFTSLADYRAALAVDPLQPQ